MVSGSAGVARAMPARPAPAAPCRTAAPRPQAAVHAEFADAAVVPSGHGALPTAPRSRYGRRLGFARAAAPGRSRRRQRRWRPPGQPPAPTARAGRAARRRSPRARPAVRPASTAARYPSARSAASRTIASAWPLSRAAPGSSNNGPVPPSAGCSAASRARAGRDGAREPPGPRRAGPPGCVRRRCLDSGGARSRARCATRRSRARRGP